MKNSNRTIKGFKKGIGKKFLSVGLAISSVLGVASTAIGCDALDYFSIGYIDGDVNKEGKQDANVKVNVNGMDIYVPTGAVAIQDANGNISTISITGEPIEKVILDDNSAFVGTPISYMQLEKYNTIYKVNTDNETVPINKKPKENSKVSIELFDGEFVLGGSEKNEEYTEVIYSSDKKGLVVGYIESEKLEKIETIEKEEENVFLEENKKMVSSGDIPLNLRNSPEINDDNIINKIDNGKIISVIKADAKTDEDRTWSLVRYYDYEKNETIIGYVASEYLMNIEENVVKEEINEENSMVYGIDSINIYGGEEIESILDELNSKYNGTKENNKNFFMFRIGASGYGVGFKDIPIDQSDMDNILYCEKNDIKYGIYYYSTCITDAEAKIEFNRINSNMDKLKSYLNQNGISKMKNNIFPIAIDIEYAEKCDRQYAFNNEEKKVSTAKSKAKLCNMLKDKYNEEPMIYIAPETLKTIMDYQTYLNNVNIDKQKVWAVYPRNASNSEQIIYDDFLQKLIDSGNEVTVKQGLLDTTLYKKVDVNEMKEEVYDNLVKEKEKSVKKNKSIIERIFGED